MKIPAFIFILFYTVSAFAQMGDWGYTIIYNGITTVAVGLEEEDTIWVCQGDSVEFAGYSAWDASFWHWEFIGGTPSVSYEQFPVITFNTPGEIIINFYVGSYMDTNDSAGVVNLRNVRVGPCPPVSHFTAPSVICQGDCISFIDSSENMPETFTWNFEGASLSSSTSMDPADICFPDPGVFLVTETVCNDMGCDTSQQYITVNDAPDGEAVNENYFIDFGGNISLSACGTGEHYIWQPDQNIDCLDCFTVTVDPAQPEITYQCIVSNTNGCSLICNYTIQVTDIPEDIFMPNTFTPNGDGLNDVFIIPENYLQISTFQVYDRWGEKVFETTEINTGWDGTSRGRQVQNGVYAYFIRYKIYSYGEEYIKRGNITLLR